MTRKTARVDPSLVSKPDLVDRFLESERERDRLANRRALNPNQLSTLKARSDH